MVNKIIKNLTDTIYKTAKVKRDFEIDNPNEKVLASDASKGIIKSNSSIKHSIDWITSQRAVLLLTETNIICGTWIIPIDNISTIELSQITSFFIKGLVLKIKTLDNTSYQFGIQFNPEWINQKEVIKCQNNYCVMQILNQVPKLFQRGLS